MGNEIDRPCKVIIERVGSGIYTCINKHYLNSLPNNVLFGNLATTTTITTTTNTAAAKQQVVITSNTLDSVIF